MIWKLLVANIPATVLYSFAGYAMINSISGWGWFLFIGLLCTTHIFNKTKEKADE